MSIRDICSLDYLMGTLATAYKGMITSLIAKDFCITEEDNKVILSGTILSMPAGDYQALLKREGIELSSAEIRRGHFEIAAAAEAFGKSKNLQIDIIQNGRHIGTFLLKKAAADDRFSSAFELSEEVKDVHLKDLFSRLYRKPGLLTRAEGLAAKIFSTKKDWKNLSEEINSFSRDLFWFDRGSYYEWFELLSRYALRACEKTDLNESRKTVENYLSLIELPLRNEKDADRLRLASTVWLRGIETSAADFSLYFRRFVMVLSDICNKSGPDKTGKALRGLLYLLRMKVENAVVIPDAVVETLRNYLGGSDLDILLRYSDEARHQLLETVTQALEMVKASISSEIFEEALEIDLAALDDRGMTDSFFGVVLKNADRDLAEPMALAVIEMFEVFEAVSPEAYRHAMTYTADLIRKMLGLGITDVCRKLLAQLEAERRAEDILLNPDVAAAISAAKDSALLSSYKEYLTGIIIPSSGVKGFSGETWAEIINPLHLERLSKFLRILSIEHTAFRDVLIHVICNLHVSGVFIPDDRLFQREVSAYLNSGALTSDFLLHYMLLKKLPVYYNEVGATGLIRDFTTEIDSWGNDTVLYFLRKQIHVNASNHNVGLIEKVIRAWVSMSVEPLRQVVPEEVLVKFDSSVLDGYSTAAVSLLRYFYVLDDTGLHPDRIMTLREEALRERLAMMDISDEVRSKIFLLLRIYQEVVKKYACACEDRKMPDDAEALMGLAGRLGQLKAVVLSRQRTRSEESFYFKRHIAFGIPSVMGSYHEPKFDAMGEAFRIEESARIFMENVNSRISEAGVQFAMEDVLAWAKSLVSAAGLFEFHGQLNFQVEEVLAILTGCELHLSQAMDLLRIWQKELAWMVEFFSRTFRGPLIKILRAFSQEELPDRVKGLRYSDRDFMDKATDIIIRDMLNSVAGCLELDGLLNNMVTALRRRLLSRSGDEIISQKEKAGEADYYMLDTLTRADAMVLAPRIGGKAKNLIYLRAGGLPVPSGAVFSAALNPQYEDYIGSRAFDEALREAVRALEERTGAVYGCMEEGNKPPLFLSVRSGAYISMPGILSSIIYCGMNDRTLKRFLESEGDAWLAWDSLRRFIENYGTAVFGLEMNFFDEIAERVSRRRGQFRRDQTTPVGLEQIVSGYRAALDDRGLHIPDDVFVQLKECIRAVYRSWHSKKARQFRQAMEVSGYWGTSVTLMEMVYGNARGAGASVFFTRSPVTLEKEIYGDTMEEVTGGDLVSGRYVSRPLSLKQSEAVKSLDETDPALFKLHEDAAASIEEAMGGLPQEVEITYTKEAGGKRVIHVLQTRRMESHRGFTKRFADVCRMQGNVIGRGAGVHGGALSGVVTFATSLFQIKKLKELYGMPVILLRNTASTEDVSLMSEINGMIAAGGGVASHAAILAQKFGLTAIVGCSDMEVKVDENAESYALIGRHITTEGTVISMDGSTGLIYSGICAESE